MNIEDLGISYENAEKDMNIFRGIILGSHLGMPQKTELLSRIEKYEKIIAPRCIICDEISSELNKDFYCQSCQAEYQDE